MAGIILFRSRVDSSGGCWFGGILLLLELVVVLALFESALQTSVLDRLTKQCSDGCLAVRTICKVGKATVFKYVGNLPYDSWIRTLNIAGDGKLALPWLGVNS